MVAIELVYRAILDLYDRDANAGDWPDGVPESFVALAGELGLDSDREVWVLVVEGYVRRRATELMAGKIRAEEWVVEVSESVLDSEVSNEEIVGSREEEDDPPSRGWSCVR